MTEEKVAGKPGVGESAAQEEYFPVLFSNGFGPKNQRDTCRPILRKVSWQSKAVTSSNGVATVQPHESVRSQEQIGSIPTENFQGRARTFANPNPGTSTSNASG